MFLLGVITELKVIKIWAVWVLTAGILVMLAGCAHKAAPGSGEPTQEAVVSAAPALTTQSPQPSGTAIPADVTALFSAHSGWRAIESLGKTEAELPTTLMTNAEASPMQFYWLRAVVLAEDSGFDLKKCLGADVTIEIYKITGGKIPANFSDSSFDNPRGIVIRDKEKTIVGAYIDTGRHAGSSFTLSLKTVEDITGQSLAEYWYQNYYDKTDPVNIAAEKRTANEVITRYFKSIASGNSAMMNSSLSIERKLESLFSNMDDHMPYNTVPEVYAYLSAVEVISIKRNQVEGDNEKLKEYEVTIDGVRSEAAKSVLDWDGLMTRFIITGSENGRICVYSDGTGP